MSDVKARLQVRQEVADFDEECYGCSFETVEGLIADWKSKGCWLENGMVCSFREETDNEYEARTRRQSKETERRRKQYEDLKKEFENVSP